LFYFVPIGCCGIWRFENRRQNVISLNQPLGSAQMAGNGIRTEFAAMFADMRLIYAYDVPSFIFK